MAHRATLTNWVAEALQQSSDRIVITGAGGWLGLATLELLANALGESWNERVVCFGSSHRLLTLRGGQSIKQAPLEEISALPKHPTILLHLAFLTKDKFEGMSEGEYETANRVLSATVLNALGKIGTEAVFVASSGAARHADDPKASSAMRLYGALKKQDEDSFAEWGSERGKTTVITRIFNIAGPYINKHGAYAIASFILDVLNGRTIKVKAPHRVVRGNVAIRELMSLIFARLLAKSGMVERFDSGGEALELQALAERVAHAVATVRVERAPITSDRVDHYVGDSRVYDELLGTNRISKVTLADALLETADFLKESRLTDTTEDRL